MKSTIWSSVIATTVLATLVIPVQPAAQDKKDPHHKHHHYQLVDMGTFGGPQSYLNDGGGITAVADVNNRGTLAGTADTSTPDPYPDFCFNEDCFVSHAFRGRNHHKIDLGVLPGGGSSASTWISANGLIVGLSQNGEIDPLIEGLPETRAVLWQNGGITDLGILPEGGYESVANAVNNHGQVAGAALNTIADSNSMFGLGYQARAFFWEDGVMRDLGTLGTGTDAQAILINDRGQVVGLSYTSSDQSAICAAVFAFPLTTSSFLWEKGKKWWTSAALVAPARSRLV